MQAVDSKIYTKTVIQNKLGCFHCVDEEFSLFDALFHALFDGGIFKTKLCIFFKDMTFFLNADSRTIANETSNSKMPYS